MGAQLGGESLDPLFSLIGPIIGLFDSVFGLLGSVFGLLGSVFGLLGSLSAGQKDLSGGVHPAQPRFFPNFVGAAPQFQAQAGDRKGVELGTGDRGRRRRRSKACSTPDRRWSRGSKTT